MGGGILRSFGKLKTVNGNSLYGIGDVSVVAGPHTHVEADITDLDKYTQAEVDALLLTKANNSHTHTKADITDFSHTHAQSDIINLITDLANKQATLVSGTNIKTINGNSLLGSGDIVLSSSMNIDGGNASSIGILMGIDGEGA